MRWYFRNDGRFATDITESKIQNKFESKQPVQEIIGNGSRYLSSGAQSEIIK
jgi:hypothetical protein